MEGSMKFLTLLLLSFLFSVLALADSNTFLSQYTTRFPALGETFTLESCFEHTKALASKMEQNTKGQIAIIDYTCHTSTLGSPLIYPEIRYMAKMGYNLEIYTHDYALIESCQMELGSVVQRYRMAGFYILDYGCRLAHEKATAAQLAVIAFNNESRSLKQLSSAVQFSSELSCDTWIEEFHTALIQSGQFAIRSFCQKQKSWNGKETSFAPVIFYATQLGRKVNLIYGSKSEKACGSDSDFNPEIFQQAKLPILGTFCREELQKDGKKSYQLMVLYLDYLLEKLKTYKSLPAATSEQCTEKMENALEKFTLSKRTILWNYCSPNEKHFLFNIHFLEPAIILSPKP
jgi:hypothetical protein